MTRKSARRPSSHFALCVDNRRYPASLERRKLYEVLPDADAESHGQLRVVDESGEDYLYPREYFQPLDLSPSVRRLVRENGRPRRKLRGSGPAPLRPGTDPYY